MGQAPIIHMMPKLYDMVEQKKVDPTDLITHRMSLDEADKAYDMFDKKEDGSIKVIFKP
jgi:S-(hydroxymethyl)glutathione dehydrogenase / alcohol dehydrogenase